MFSIFFVYSVLKLNNKKSAKERQFIQLPHETGASSEEKTNDVTKKSLRQCFPRAQPCIYTWRKSLKIEAGASIETERCVREKKGIAPTYPCLRYRLLAENKKSRPDQSYGRRVPPISLPRQSQKRVRYNSCR